MISTYTWEVKNDKFYADERLAYIFGVSHKEASEGLPLEIFTKSIFKDDLERVMKLVKDALTSGVYEAEYRVIGADGMMRWVLARGKVKFDENH